MNKQLFIKTAASLSELQDITLSSGVQQLSRISSLDAPKLSNFECLSISGGVSFSYDDVRFAFPEKEEALKA